MCIQYSNFLLSIPDERVKATARARGKAVSSSDSQRQGSSEQDSFTVFSLAMVKVRQKSSSTTSLVSLIININVNSSQAKKQQHKIASSKKGVIRYFNEKNNNSINKLIRNLFCSSSSWCETKSYEQGTNEHSLSSERMQYSRRARQSSSC